jgi:hypothetical protein
LAQADLELAEHRRSGVASARALLEETCDPPRSCSGGAIMPNCVDICSKAMLLILPRF